jgi:hypothetical protein
MESLSVVPASTLNRLVRSPARLAEATVDTPRVLSDV